MFRNYVTPKHIIIGNRPELLYLLHVKISLSRLFVLNGPEPFKTFRNMLAKYSRFDTRFPAAPPAFND